MRWVRRGTTTLVGLTALAFAILFGGSALLMQRDVDAPLPRIKAITDPAGIIEGGRLASITGCTRCHGSRAQGRTMSDVPYIGHIVAPALPQVAAQATDGQMARAIRMGVGIDARPLYIMPSHAYNALSDNDLARLLGWIRILPTTAFDVVGSTPVGVQGRFAILTGRLPDSVALRQGQPKVRPADIGRYFSQISCAQCHALSQSGPADAMQASAPPLAVAVRSYDSMALRTLLRTGQGRGRSLPTMTEASRSGLAQLNDAEIDAIHAYLMALGSQRAGR